MAKAKSLAEITQIVDQITYKRWQFRLIEKGDGFLLQAKWYGRDSEDWASGPLWEQISRKWYISPYACEREIVDTAWALVERAENHESRELFRYHGEAIFNRHIKPEALVKVARDVQTRESE